MAVHITPSSVQVHSLQSSSVLTGSPRNVYLHYALDQWFEDDVKPQLAEHARLIRYCDDFVLGASASLTKANRNTFGVNASG